MGARQITLEEAAEALGVHYMTVYRYVRTGRLPAVKEGTEWRVDPVDLDLVRRSTEPPASPRPGRRRIDYASRLEDRLVVSDEPGAWTVVQSALGAGLEPEALYLEVLSPALEGIGDRWEAGSLTVAQEHQASALVQRIIGRLGPMFRRPGRTKGTIVVGARPGDHHALPSALLADLLRQRNFTVVDLGADTPATSFADALRAADRPVAVGISATGAADDEALRRAVAAVRAVGDVPIVVGGSGIAGPDHAAALGADHYTPDAEAAVALFDALGEEAGRARRRARRAGA